jgi:hypothetical protein
MIDVPDERIDLGHLVVDLSRPATSTGRLPPRKAAL